jgi:hypothetical protein
MSKRNSYRINLKEDSDVEAIIESLKSTGVKIHNPEEAAEDPVTFIKADDAPMAGEGYPDLDRYVKWRHIRSALEDYTDQITTVVHIRESDSTPITEQTEYSTSDDASFTKENYEEYSHYDL